MSSAILESVERLSKLINDVLDLTTGDTRGVALEKERVDVAGLCRAAVETAEPQAAEKAQKLEVEISPVGGSRVRRRPAAARVDRACAAERHRLHRPQGPDQRCPRTATRSRRRDPISDNGSGIAAEDLPRVFDRFDRVAEAGVRGEAALGLGLPLTRQFIEAHGGTVELQFGEGQGHDA